jgi:hypothetical protein
MFWDLCGTVSPVISCSAKLWLYFPAGNIIKASGVFFGIVEDTASLQKTFKKRESSKLPHPVFNRSFAVKWRFCVPFLLLNGQNRQAETFQLSTYDPWKAVHRLSVRKKNNVQAFRSPKNYVQAFLPSKNNAQAFTLPVLVLLPASHSLRTVAPIHRQGFDKPIEFSKLILYCYFYYISHPHVDILSSIPIKLFRSVILLFTST